MPENTHMSENEHVQWLKNGFEYDENKSRRAVAWALRRIDQLESAIRTHRSQKADDRCIEDDDRLYEALGDGIKCDRRIGYDANKLMQSVIACLARHTAKDPMRGVPLWAVVMDFTGYGSTSASEICRQFGFDASVKVNAPEFVDFSCQAVLDYCGECEAYYHGEEEKCDCEAGGDAP